MNEKLADIAKTLERLKDALAPKQEIPLSEAGNYAFRTLKSILADTEPERRGYRLGLFMDELSNIRDVLKQSEAIEDLGSQRVTVTVFEEPGLTETPQVASETSPAAGQPALGESAVQARFGGLDKALAALTEALHGLTASDSTEPAAKADEEEEEDDDKETAADAGAQTDKSKDKERDRRKADGEKEDEEEDQAKAADVAKSGPGWLLDMNQSIREPESVTKREADDDWGTDPKSLAQTA